MEKVEIEGAHYLDLVLQSFCTNATTLFVNMTGRPAA
jgi:hypothetical protein